LNTLEGYGSDASVKNARILPALPAMDSEAKAGSPG